MNERNKTETDSRERTHQWSSIKKKGGGRGEVWYKRRYKLLYAK